LVIAMIVVKSNFDGDLRRFTVDPSITFAAFCALLAKVYDREQSSFTIKYTAEEGVPLRLTSDMVLKEAFRITSSMKTPILRLTLSAAISQPKSEKSNPPNPTANPLPIVYIQGKPYVPSVPVKPDWESLKKCCGTTVATTVLVSKPQPQPQANEEDSDTESDGEILAPAAQTPASPQSFVVAPVVIVQPTDSDSAVRQQENLASMCSNLAESIARVCMDSSNALMLQTNELSQSMAEGVQETSASTSRDMSAFSSRSVYSLDDATRQEMTKLSDQVLKDVDSFVTSTIDSSNQFSDSVLFSIDNIPSDTIHLQDEALKDLQAQLSEDVAAVVRQTLAAMSM